MFKIMNVDINDNTINNKTNNNDLFIDMTDVMLQPNSNNTNKILNLLYIQDIVADLASLASTKPSQTNKKHWMKKKKITKWGQNINNDTDSE